MTDEPLARLEPFIHGDGTPRDKLTRKQAIALHNELLQRIPDVVDSLRDLMLADSVVLGDGPRADAEAAGEWLVEGARLVPAERPTSPDPFWTGDPVLSLPTKSACFRVGLFCGACIQSQIPEAKWMLDTSNKRHILYHYTVLLLPGSEEMFEPFNATMSFVRKRLRLGFQGTLGTYLDEYVEGQSKHS